MEVKENDDDVDDNDSNEEENDELDVVDVSAGGLIRGKADALVEAQMEARRKKEFAESRAKTRLAEGKNMVPGEKTIAESTKLERLSTTSMTVASASAKLKKGGAKWGSNKAKLDANGVPTLSRRYF